MLGNAIFLTKNFSTINYLFPMAASMMQPNLRAFEMLLRCTTFDFKNTIECLRSNDPIETSITIGQDCMNDDIHCTFFDALAQNTTVVSLAFYGANMGRDVWSSFMTALRTNTTLTTLRFNCQTIADAGYLELFTVLSGHTSITHLVFDTSPMNNDTFTAFAEMLTTNTTLLGLSLIHVNLGAAHYYSLGKAISANTTLTSLYLADTREIGVNGCIYLSDALALNTSITDVSISNCGIGATEAIILSKMIATHTSICCLELNFIDIGDDGIVALATSLKTNKIMRKFVLTNKTITYVGYTALFNMLAVNTTLIECVINTCTKGIPAEARRLIESNTTLTHLSIHPEINDIATRNSHNKRTREQTLFEALIPSLPKIQATH